ncbi:MAG: hypothetical protein K6E98_06040 [Lachnospiraceae bacterium]|nr:hypothetical protein [Lachnospiraceae bacterium]
MNLRNVDREMAEYIRSACDYMYKEYPILNGFLTNITVLDEVSESYSAIALYENDSYIINSDSDRLYPIVIRRRILLRAKDFELGYALGLQEDGGYSYEVTIAEAISHEYVHGEDSSSAVRMMIRELKKVIEKYPG